MGLRLLVPTAMLAAACAPFAVSPPTRSVPLETAATSGTEHTSLAGSAGYHELEVFAAAGRVSHGVSDKVDLQFDGTYSYYGILAGRHVSDHVLAVRAGVKHLVWEHAAFTGGLGVGSGPWGVFGGPDLGFVLAYENSYFVPFFSARTSLSVPMSIDRETVVESNGMGGTRTTTLTPPVTWYLQPAVGAKLVLCREQCDPELVDISLIAAISWTHFVRFESEVHQAATFGFEAGFGLRL